MNQLLQELLSANEQGDVEYFNAAIYRYLSSCAADTEHYKIAKDAIKVVEGLLTK